jgi:hypothetical protein
MHEIIGPIGPPIRENSSDAGHQSATKHFTPKSSSIQYLYGSYPANHNPKPPFSSLDKEDATITLRKQPLFTQKLNQKKANPSKEEFA